MAAYSICRITEQWINDRVLFVLQKRAKKKKKQIKVGININVREKGYHVTMLRCKYYFYGYALLC